MVEKVFANPADALVAERAQRFIDEQPHGAGTWPDGADVRVPRTRGVRLHITDKVGSEQGPMERWIEVKGGGRVIVTFVYNHHTQLLERTF